MARVLVISDLQQPFAHPDFLDFLKNVAFKYRTDTTVCVGDEIDFHAISDYSSDPDGYSAGHELTAAINKLIPYYKAFPRVKLCESNHVDRLKNRAFKAGIPARAIVEFKKIIEAPTGWNWSPQWEIDGVLYKHGKGYSGVQGALNAAKDNFQSCVIGHLHADAGILYFSNGVERVFGMNVGSGIDAAAYAFNYGKDCRKKPIISCGVVIDRQPHLIMMNLNQKGRWDGKV